MDVAGMTAAFGQDVDPDVFELEVPPVQVKLQILGEGGHMLVQQFDQIGKYREPPARSVSEA